MPTSAKTLPVAVRTRGVVADRGALRALLRRCLDSGGAAPGAGLSLVLAGDRLVRRLNREWRGRDRSTDVLSFPAGDPLPLPPAVDDPVGLCLGEIVVSLPRCREQAAEQGVDPGVELTRLVIHGALHLLGHDHECAGPRARMRACERRLRAWAGRQGIGPGLLRAPGPVTPTRRPRGAREGRLGRHRARAQPAARRGAV